MRGLVGTRKRKNVAEEDLFGTLACMTGGLVLARSANAKDSAAILAACRNFLHRVVTDIPKHSAKVSRT
jgi:hypothetical protein